MSTTNLFVELVVIGVGAAIWIVLLGLAVIGCEWATDIEAVSLVAIVPTLAVVYVLGIVSDRMIDLLFGRIWGEKMRARQFPNTRDYHEARRRILESSETLAEMHEYGRSRLRICRGWTVHAFLIAISLVVFSWTRIDDDELAMRVSIFGSSVFCLLGTACWYSWRYLLETQYLKVREQATPLGPQSNLMPNSQSGEPMQLAATDDKEANSLRTRG